MPSHCDACCSCSQRIGFSQNSTFQVRIEPGSGPFIRMSADLWGPVGWLQETETERVKTFTAQERGGGGGDPAAFCWGSRIRGSRLSDFASETGLLAVVLMKPYLQQWTAVLVMHNSLGNLVCCAAWFRVRPLQTARLRSPGSLA